VSFTSVAVLVWVGVFGLGLHGLWRTARPRPGAAEAREVAIACPARDEREVIDACLDGLLAQGAGAVVVVDDGSTDGTRERLQARAEEGGFLLLEAPERPAGAKGKPAALACAAARLSPSPAAWLLFVDADVVLAPGAAAALVDHARERQLDLLSAHPRQQLGTLLEQVVMPAVGSLVFLAHPPSAVSQTRPFANGQLLLVRRAAYADAGGHAAVRGEILEDVRLAEAVAGRGGRLAAVDGRHLGETRMYAGARELREGWEKNLALLLEGRLGPTVAGSLALAWLGPAAALVDGAAGLGGWVLIASMQAILRGLGGAAPWAAPFAPLGAAAAAGLAVSSWWRHRQGRPLRWKGRAYRPRDG
jgi:hypothetical protein